MDMEENPALSPESSHVQSSDASSTDSSGHIHSEQGKVVNTVSELYENGASEDEFEDVPEHHRAAAICASMVEQEDVRIVGPMKRTTVGHELKHPKWAYKIAPYFKIYAILLTIGYIVLSIAPMVIAPLFYTVNPIFCFITISLTILILVVSIPFFYMIVNWQPFDPALVHQYRMRTVDILLTCYKEDMSVISNTLMAIQRINYSPQFLTAYVLDDGHRECVEEYINEMNATNPPYPVIYVSRPNNKGRKGGNINHFIKRFEETASEFFIVLDADMAPFPEIFDILFGAYYGYPKDVRDRIAFIQCPQHFKNHIPESDWYDLGMTFFYKCVMTCMSELDVAMYIGTCGLWRRSAIVFGGGFHEAHATEDTVTGCYVHRTKIDLLDPESFNWSSKFINIPIAAGISPGTLPQQIDQRLRWCLGSVQMYYEHDRFVRAAGLGVTQRITYLATVGYWVLGMASFSVTFVSSLTVLGYIMIRGIILGGEDSSFPFWLLIIQFFAFTLYFAALPVSSQADKLRAIQMFSTFMPVYLVAYLNFRGFNVKVQTTAAGSEEDTRRWHPFFWFHVSVVGITSTMAALAVYFGGANAVNISTAVCHSSLWWISYFPVVLSLCGYTHEKIHPRYVKEEAEAEDLENARLSVRDALAESQASSVQ